MEAEASSSYIAELIKQLEELKKKKAHREKKLKKLQKCASKQQTQLKENKDICNIPVLSTSCRPIKNEKTYQSKTCTGVETDIGNRFYCNEKHISFDSHKNESVNQTDTCISCIKSYVHVNSTDNLISKSIGFCDSNLKSDCVSNNHNDQQFSEEKCLQENENVKDTLHYGNTKFTDNLISEGIDFCNPGLQSDCVTKSYNGQHSLQGTCLQGNINADIRGVSQDADTVKFIPEVSNDIKDPPDLKCRKRLCTSGTPTAEFEIINTDCRKRMKIPGKYDKVSNCDAENIALNEADLNKKGNTSKNKHVEGDLHVSSRSMNYSEGNKQSDPLIDDCLDNDMTCFLSSDVLVMNAEDEKHFSNSAVLLNSSLKKKDSEELLLPDNQLHTIPSSNPDYRCSPPTSSKPFNFPKFSTPTGDVNTCEIVIAEISMLDVNKSIEYSIPAESSGENLKSIDKVSNAVDSATEVKEQDSSGSENKKKFNCFDYKNILGSNLLRTLDAHLGSPVKHKPLNESDDLNYENILPETVCLSPLENKLNESEIPGKMIVHEAISTNDQSLIAAQECNFHETICLPETDCRQPSLEMSEDAENVYNGNNCIDLPSTEMEENSTCDMGGLFVCDTSPDVVDHLINEMHLSNYSGVTTSDSKPPPQPITCSENSTSPVLDYNKDFKFLNTEISNNEVNNSTGSQITKTTNKLIDKVCESSFVFKEPFDIDNTEKFPNNHPLNKKMINNLKSDSEILFVPETEGFELTQKESGSLLENSVSFHEEDEHSANCVVEGNMEIEIVPNITLKSNIDPSPCIANVNIEIHEVGASSSNNYSLNNVVEVKEQISESITSPSKLNSSIKANCLPVDVMGKRQEPNIENFTCDDTSDIYESMAADTSFLCTEDSQELGKYKRLPFTSEINAKETSNVKTCVAAEKQNSNLNFICCLHSEVKEPVNDVQLILFNNCNYLFFQHTTQIQVWRQERNEDWVKIFYHQVDNMFQLRKMSFSNDDDYLVLIMLLCSEQEHCLQFLLFERGARVIKLMENTHWLKNRFHGDSVLLCSLDGLMFATAEGKSSFEVFVHAFSNLKDNPSLITAALGSTNSPLCSLCKIEKLPNALMGISDSTLYVWHLLETRLVTAVTLQPRNYLPISGCFWAIVEKGLVFLMTICEDNEDSKVCQLLAANLATGFCECAMSYTLQPAKVKKQAGSKVIKAAYYEPFLLVSYEGSAFIWSVTDEYCCATLSGTPNVTSVAVGKNLEGWGIVAVGSNTGCVNCYNLN